MECNRERLKGAAAQWRRRAAVWNGQYAATRDEFVAQFQYGLAVAPDARPDAFARLREEGKELP